MIILLARRLIVGSEAEGLFTLFAMMFFFIGLALFGIGLLGEYVGRIYAQVRERPRFIVEAVLEHSGADTPGADTPDIATPAAPGADTPDIATPAAPGVAAPRALALTDGGVGLRR
jgi:undecaprenyl-phosphate 4-deoxy-4-formamido-L-arabinose transferase